MLQQLRVQVLHALAQHCGCAALGRKAERVAEIAAAQATHHTLLAHTWAAHRPLRVLSVDVGLKNFSFCVADYSEGGDMHIAEWLHLNLHEQYGPGDMSRTYLAKLAVCVVDDVFLRHQPHVATIEMQRTRSNNNQVTLPNVQLNASLEYMLYAAHAARAQPGTLLVPVHATKLANFWLGRFTGKKVQPPAKRLRSALVSSWLTNPRAAPFDFSAGRSYTEVAQSRVIDSLLHSYGVSAPKKDDLIDSLLYNMAYALQFRHLAELSQCVDVPALVHRWDTEHLSYIGHAAARLGLEIG